MKYYALMFLSVFNIGFCADQVGFTVVGKIRGHDGAALPRADVFVFKYGDATPMATAMADSSGVFHLNIDSPGAYRVVLSGVGCTPFEAPLLVVRSMNIRVAANLSPYEY